MSSLASLHRYFMAANKMRICFQKIFKDPDFLKKYEGQNPLVTLLVMHADDYGIFMFYWYAGIYVVIEGYQELGLEDPIIDNLLKSPNVAYLKRCRNGTFHFQKDYLSSKLQEFMAQKDSVSWIGEITEAFSQFFLREIPKLKT
jgi:hypothetical protein